MLCFTVFNSYDTTSKVPSAHKDIFNFRNILVPFNEVHKLFKSNFILSRPLIKDLTSKRDNSLTEFYDTSSQYCVLDFDDIESIDQVNLILDYFKNNNYSINLFKSRSYGIKTPEGIKYNLKGVMLIQTESSKTMTQTHLNFLSSNLEGLCTLDFSSSHTASYQAPAFNTEQLLFIEGVTISYEDLVPYIPKAPQKMDYDFNEESTTFFWNNIITRYGGSFKSYINPNGTINIHLPSEKKTNFSYFWNPKFPWKIQHPNNLKSIDMFQDFIQSNIGKKFIKEKNLQKFQNYFNQLDANIVLSQNNRYMEVQEDIKNIKDYNILMVKGLMGGGKSNISEFFTLTNKRVLYITMRKSLSYDMYEKYNTKHYIEDFSNALNKYRQGDNLVIQVDSIHKINPNFFDTIVIDEFESLCLYTQSFMTKSTHYVKNMKTLFDLFNSNKKFILMDTFLNNFSTNLFFKGNKTLIQNEYLDDAKVYVYSSLLTFINVLEHRAKSKETNEVISCSFGTLTELNATKKLLDKHNIKTVVLNSDTPEELKKLMSVLFKESIVQYDVIMYSPTITVGVSILNNIKHHFHYDSGKSIDPISSVQMMKRSRNALYIHTYIEGDKVQQKSYDVTLINEKAKARLNNLKLVDSLVFYNSDTNDLSELGKFVNKFQAHKNFYDNNHRETCLHLLKLQFKNIIPIEDESNNASFKELLKKEKKEKAQKDLFNGYVLQQKIDVLMYDELSNIKNPTKEEKQLLILIQIKREFFKLNDDIILQIAKCYILDKDYIIKINNLYFYTLNDKNKKTKFLEALQKNHKSSLEASDFKLYEFLKDIKLKDLYTAKEVKNLNTLNYIKVGYKKRNGCLVLDTFIKEVVDLLI